MLYTVVVLAWLAHMTTGEPARKSKYLIQPKDCTHSIMYDCYEKEKPNLKGTIICLNFTEQMLKDQLKNAGGYNPRYMAANLYEALKFEDPSGWTYTTTTGPPLVVQEYCLKDKVYPRGHVCYKPNTYKIPTGSTSGKTKPQTTSRTTPQINTTPRPRTTPRATSRTTPRTTSRTTPRTTSRTTPRTTSRTTPPTTSRTTPRTTPQINTTPRPRTTPRANTKPWRWTEEPVIEGQQPIGRRFRWPLEGQQPISRRFRWPLEGPKRIIHPDSTEGRHRMKRMIGGAGECWEKGTQTQGSSRYHMCTFCHRITQLPDDQFPRYINEVVCRHSLGAASGAVASDQFCVANAGECSQKILKLEGLIFTGYEPAPDLGNNIYKPKWETTTLNIRSCCDCEMYGNMLNMMYFINGL